MPSHDKKSAADLRKELRELRKESVKPVSKMRVGDVSAEIERLRNDRETTPAAAAVPNVPAKSMGSSVKSIKEAKRMEFPVAPSDSNVKKGGATGKAKKTQVAPAPEEKKKMSMKDKMAKMLAMMDEEEE